jgi:6-phosphogluconolactonase (cycloisomerase 2 family)
VIGVNAGLTLLPATPRSAGPDPVWISIVPNGTFAYIGAGGSANGGIQAFSLALDGTPLPVVGSPFSAPPSVVQIAIDPLGRFLYTASPGAAPLAAGPAPGFVNAFTIQSTGFLLPVSGSPFAVPTPGGVAIARF